MTRELKRIRIPKFRVVEIQSSARNFERPLRFLISPTGLVGRQEYWRGAPYKLIGFTQNARGKSIDLPFDGFWRNPGRCVGMYPVFEHQDRTWHTYGAPIENYYSDENESDI